MGGGECESLVFCLRMPGFRFAFLAVRTGWNLETEDADKVTHRCSTYFFYISKARFTANPKLAFQAQTLDLRAFRFAKKC